MNNRINYAGFIELFIDVEKHDEPCLLESLPNRKEPVITGALESPVHPPITQE